MSDQSRLEVVLEFLKQQDIDEVCELVHFPLAHTLVGANLLLEEELAAINRLAMERTTVQRFKHARADYTGIAEDTSVTPKSVEIVPADAKIVSFCRQRLLKDTVDARFDERSCMPFGYNVCLFAKVALGGIAHSPRWQWVC